MAAAVPVVERGEHVHGGAEPLDIGYADPDAARWLVGHLARIDQPPQGSVIPDTIIGVAPLKRGRVAQVDEPQLGHVLRGIGRRVRVGHVELGRCPGSGHQGQAGADEAERAACGRRQAQAVGELLERGHALGHALARCPLAEAALGDAGQLGYPALGQPVGALIGERGDDRAEVAPGAGVQHIRTRAQTRSTIARTSAGFTAIGVLPVSLWSLASCPSA